MLASRLSALVLMAGVGAVVAGCLSPRTAAAEAGYVLNVDGAGRVRLTLRAGGQAACSRASAAAVNDGQWQHVIAEVDRSSAWGIAVYAGGKRDAGAVSRR